MTSTKLDTSVGHIFKDPSPSYNLLLPVGIVTIVTFAFDTAHFCADEVHILAGWRGIRFAECCLWSTVSGCTSHTVPGSPAQSAAQIPSLLPGPKHIMTSLATSRQFTHVLHLLWTQSTPATSVSPSFETTMPSSLVCSWTQHTLSKHLQMAGQT